jgi:lipopolysaccharide export LptBFGC system permease protein LptF
MPNYQNGKIYKIHSYKTDKIYIGSTTVLLCKRFTGHKTDNKTGRGTLAKQIFEYDDVMITLIENYPCNDRNELEKRERYHIENNNCINKNIPTRTNKEWKLINKDKIKKTQQQYELDNKDKIKQYRIDNKDKRKEISRQYYEKYKNQIIKKNKKYDEINKTHKLNIQKQYDKHRRSHFGIICKSFGIF